MSRRRSEGFIEGDHYEVDPETGCWNWLRYKTYQGYGMATASKGDGRERRAHRESWRLANGPIPEGLVIDHLCRNKGCINPEHLDCVRQAVNTWRGDMPKLDQEKVAEIRHRIVAGEFMSAIARDFGLHVDAVFRIAEDSRWREDPDAPQQVLRPNIRCGTCCAELTGRRDKRYCDITCKREAANKRRREAYSVALRERQNDGRA